MSSNVEDPKMETYKFMTGLVDPPHGYAQRWTPREEHKAVSDYRAGIPIEYIAERLGRSVHATRTRVYQAIGKWKRPAQKLKVKSSRGA